MSTRSWPASVRNVVLALFCAASVVWMVITAVVLYRYLYDESIAEGSTIAWDIANACADGMVSRDAAAVQSVIDVYEEQQRVAYIFLTDANDKFICHTFVPHVPREVVALGRDSQRARHTRLVIPDYGEVVDISVPLLAGAAGYVHVGLQHRRIYGQIIAPAATILGAMLVILLASGLFLHFWLTRRLRPLHALNEYARRLGNGDYTARLEAELPDEWKQQADVLQLLAGKLLLVPASPPPDASETPPSCPQALNRLTLLFDTLPAGVLLMLKKQNLVLGNPALRSMLGQPPEAAHGLERIDALPAPLADLVDLALEHPHEILAAACALPPDKTVLAEATALVGNAADPEEVSGAVVGLCDISDEKQADRQKTLFLAALSGELRSALAALTGSAGSMKKQLEPTLFARYDEADPGLRSTIRQIRDTIDIIMAEGHRLQDLLGDIHDVAALHAGASEWKESEITLADIVEQAATRTRALYENRDVTLQVLLPDTLPPLRADAEQLVRALACLIAHAVDRTLQGAVVIAAEKHGEMLRVRVQDTGAAPDENARRRLFDPFGTRSSPDEPLSGIDPRLPLCKGIIESHGGEIDFTSTPGKGNTASFTLPLQPTAAHRARQSLVILSRRRKDPPLTVEQA